MSQRTALVTGATGLLGRQIATAFRNNGWTVKGTGYSRADGVDILKVDLGNEDELKAALDDVKPQVIVHSAAQRFPDKVDKDPEGAKALNVAASRSLARLAANRGIFLLYISTDYVFPGTPGQAPYENDAKPGPTNLYGQTKFDGETAILDEYFQAGQPGFGVVLRVPVLYGHAETPSESAVNVLLDSVWKAQTEGAKIKMDHWSLRYPTNTEDVGRVCKDVATKYLETSDRASLPKILQFSSEDKMTKYEICQKFGEIMGLSIDGIEANSEGNDPNASVQRPYDCHLSTKALKDLGISVFTQNFTDWWRREVRAFRKASQVERRAPAPSPSSPLSGFRVGSASEPPPTPPPLTPPPPPPPPVDSKPASRYRSLRGKSVSSVHPKKSFEIYRDNASNDEGDRLQVENLLERRRSKSLSHTRLANGNGKGKGKGYYNKGLENLAARALTELKLGGAGAGNHGGASVLDLQKPVPPLPTPTNVPLVPFVPLAPRNTNIPSTPSSPIASAKSSLGGTQAFPRADPALLKALNKRVGGQNKASPSQSPLRQPNRRPSTPQSNQAEAEAAWVAYEVARLEAETDRIIEEQKKLDLARLQAQLAVTPTRPKPRRIAFDNLLFFSKKKSSAPSTPAPVTSQPTTPKSAPPAFFSLDWNPKAPSLEVSLHLSDNDEGEDNSTTKRSSNESDHNHEGDDGDKDNNMAALVEHGRLEGIGLALQDAPTSASNAGERRVTVRCLSATINLPVTTSTNPVDIIYSTANLITHKIDPSNCIVVECFGVFGLERRLRRYEHLRDVMNSWDRDTENTLLVLTEESQAENKNLHLSSVPRTEEPPPGFTFQLYHSSQPRKWNKRWVTLMDNGQVFTSKRPESKSTDKDSTFLCHLSDFDIYTPTEAEKSRHLKPPKKHCYAIKSQQKTTVFTNGQNFIHHFALEDADQARRFYDLVHGWRSWYLVNKSLDLNKKNEPPRSSVTSAESMRRSKSLGRRGTTRTVRASTEQKPYTIGEFQPLLNMSQFDKPLEEFGKGQFDTTTLPTPVEESPKPKMLRKTRTAPPAVPQPAPSESEFLAGGLLGAGYEKRKQAVETGSGTIVKKLEGPFTEGPSLLNKAASPTSPKSKKDEASSWFPSALEHSAREQGQGRRPSAPDMSRRGGPHQPHPLVNLTNTFPENSRHGRRPGRGIKAPDGAPLIDFASGGTMNSAPMPSRSTSRAGSMVGGGSPGPRPRSRSSASMSGGSRSGSRRYIVPEDQPPVPPLPHRSVQRTGTTGPSAEPLINRAK